LRLAELADYCYNPTKHMDNQPPLPHTPPAALPPVEAPQIIVPGPQPAPAPASNKRKKLIIVGCGVLVAIVIAAGAFYFFKRPEHTSQTSKAPPAPTADTLPKLPKASDVTAASLPSFNKDTLFWGYFGNAALQQKVIATHTEIHTPAPGLTDIDYIRSGFDYQTKKGGISNDEYDAYNDDVGYRIRCSGGKYWDQSNTKSHTGPWLEDSALDGVICSPKGLAPYITDGFTPGGLTRAQASAFIDFLRSRSGLIDVKSMTLESHAGKAYLHFVVDLTPIKAEGDYADVDLYQGNEWLVHAFKKTGLDPDTHPYTFKLHSSGGMHINYFVDPQTQLPKYVQIDDTPFKNNDGTFQKLDYNIPLTTTFQYGVSAVDTSINNTADIRLDW